MLSFRVDDFPYTKPDETWRHNLHTFAKFDEVMRKHGHTYTLGVIPTKLTLQEIEFLKTLPHVDLALHGVYHDERYQNEFRAWQTDSEVYDSLRSAKALLDTIGGPVDTYIPPHNVIDRRTVNALYDLGFTRLWGGPESDQDVFDYAYVLKKFETRIDKPPLYGRTDEMMERRVPEYIRKSLTVYPDKVINIGLHWTWETNIGLEHLDRFLAEIV